MALGVTAIVVNWNGASYLPDCLGSLEAQTHAPLQIVVVDNGSTDASVEIARGFNVDWVQIETNTGLAPAMNVGVAHAKHPLLLFLNNDMRFEPIFVAELVACRETHPDAGAIDAVQRDWATGEVVHSATRLEKAFGQHDFPGWQFRMTQVEQDAPTVFASGANTLVTRAVFDELGRWDDRFFAGWEDADLGWRLWLNGRGPVLASRAVAVHDVSATSNSAEGLPIRSEAAMHGRLLFAIKHAPVTIILRVIGRFTAGWTRDLVRRDKLALAARGRVFRRLRTELPDAWGWRRRTYRACGTSPSRHWRRMTEVGTGSSVRSRDAK